jgi:hypothetical protein
MTPEHDDGRSLAPHFVPVPEGLGLQELGPAAREQLASTASPPSWPRPAQSALSVSSGDACSGTDNVASDLFQSNSNSTAAASIQPLSFYSSYAGTMPTLASIAISPQRSASSESQDSPNLEPNASGPSSLPPHNVQFLHQPQSFFTSFAVSPPSHPPHRTGTQHRIHPPHQPVFVVTYPVGMPAHIAPSTNPLSPAAQESGPLAAVTESPLVATPVQPCEQSPFPKASESANVSADSVSNHDALTQAHPVIATDVGSMSFLGDLPDPAADHADSLPIPLSSSAAAVSAESSGNVPLLFHFPSFKS